MVTRQIRREEWITFFDDFSKQHEGWIITLETLGSDLGDQDQIDGLPLIGVTADLKERENRVGIIAGGRPDADVTHFINAPRGVWFKQSRDLGDDALEIESEDGIKTILHFRRIPSEVAERQIEERVSTER